VRERHCLTFNIEIVYLISKGAGDGYLNLGIFAEATKAWKGLKSNGLSGDVIYQEDLIYMKICER